MVICEVTPTIQTTMPGYAKVGHVKIEIKMDLDALGYWRDQWLLQDAMDDGRQEYLL